jgi:hypothetical protein
MAADSLNWSTRMAKFILVALEGDYCDRLDEIALACGRRLVGNIRFFSDWSSVAPFARQKGYLAAVRSGDWTILMDDWDLTAKIFDAPAAGAAIASTYSTRVVCALGHSVTGDFGFQVHMPGHSRSVLVTADGLLEDEGEPLPGEEPIDPDEFNENDVLNILDSLGVDIADGVETSSQSALLELSPKSDEQVG